MLFTYASLGQLMANLRGGGYIACTYHDYPTHGRCVILRHDVDYDPGRSLELARLEASWGVRSTYFFLVSSPLYNSLCAEVSETIREIVSLGHEVGLHFDETRYPTAVGDAQAMVEAIRRETDVLSLATGVEVRTVSMHRPSRWTLDVDLEVPRMVNSCGRTFFRDFKYLSDSRRRWREPVEKIVSSGEFERLHILTHAFWYAEEDRDIHTAVAGFVNRGSADRYREVADNITDLASIMDESEVLA